MKHFYLFVFVVIEVCCGLGGWANELWGQMLHKREEMLNPFIRNYTPEEYGQLEQNWAIVQDSRGIMYVANNGGLMEYDGVRWRMIQLGDGNTVSSLAIDNKDRIFIGGYDELGYLGIDSIGRLKYHSLFPLLPQDKRDFQSIYSIEIYQNEVYYQGENHLYRYNPNTKKITAIWDGDFHKIIRYKERLYVRDRAKGLLELLNGQLVPLPFAERFIQDQVYFMLPHESGQLLLGTREQGLLFFNTERKTLTPFRTEIDQYLLNNNLYCGILSKEGYYAFGTAKGGMVFMTANGKLIQIIDEERGLQNNDVTYIFEDQTNSIWAALGNGLAKVNNPARLSYFNRINNQKRSFLKFARFQGYLLAMTENGLYRTRFTTKKGIETVMNFEAVHEISDQCWDILTLPNEVLVATTESGIYGYNLNQAYVVNAIYYPSFVLYRSKKDSNRVYIGLKDGIASIYKRGAVWEDEGRIPGVNEQIRHIAETPNGNLWLAGFTGGAFYLDLNADRKNPPVKRYGKEHGLLTLQDLAVLNQPDGRILFYHLKGFARFNEKTQKFEPETEFAPELADGSHGIWYFTQNKVTKTGWAVVVHPDNISVEDQLYAFFPGKNGYRIQKNLFARLGISKINIVFPESDNVVWLGYGSGVARLNLNYQRNNNFSYKTVVRRIIANSKETIFDGNFIGEDGFISFSQPNAWKPALDYVHNSLRFECAALSYDRSEANEYQYWLEGSETEWSPWTKEAQKDYTNLPEGNYKFHVRSRNIFGVMGQESVYEFTINPPWYRWKIAYVAYLLLAGGAVVGFIRWRVRKLEQDKRILEQKVAERTAEVVRQAKELEEKNHEIIQINEEIIQQRDEILAYNEQITKQKEEIEHKNEEILDSINYARRIQDAILPEYEVIRKALPESFVLYRPKDVVSGDFFWFSEYDDLKLIAAVDCTGHGIPGAFMSVMGSSLLNQIVNEKGLTDPGTILNTLNELVRANLHQVDHTSSSKDGMDLTLAVIDYPERKVYFGGANNPLYHVSGGELTEYKTNKYPIGGGQYEGRHFTTQELICQPGDMIFLFSDGYADQFGGPNRKKFMYGKFKKLLVEVSTLPIDEQKEHLNTIIENWMHEGNIDQIDDILVIGIRF
jgi:serine phosphatase RsbU (regulator of sigma subunit)